MKIDSSKIDILICEKGIMLKDIAVASGISENAFRAIRQGKSEPRLATIGRIANALGVGVQDIIVQEGGMS